MSYSRYHSEEPVLIELFEAIRAEGVQLGLQELIASQKALLFGLGGNSMESIRSLLQMLWLGSKDEYPIFDKCFQRYWDRIKTDLRQLETDPIDQTRSFRAAKADDMPAEREELKSEESGDLSPPPASEKPSEEATINLPAASKEAPDTEFQLVHQHDPASPLLLRRSYQHLRSEYPTYAELDLDIGATIKNIAKQGYFDEAVFRPRIQHDLNLLFFIDAGGSMVPQMDFCQRWRKAIHASVRYRISRTCYFDNVPGSTVFTDMELSEEIPLRRFWGNVPPGRTVALIISDAGAARGSWDSMRILDSRDFARTLMRKGIAQLWLNPMRRDWWKDSSAAKISTMVPKMLSMHQSDLRETILYINQRLEGGSS